MEQQVKEMEKQIQQAGQCMAGQDATTSNMNSSWDRANLATNLDPPPPGLDGASSTSSASNQPPERTKKRSSRYIQLSNTRDKFCSIRDYKIYELL